MVIHHLLYNLVEFLGAPEWLFTNPVFDVLHYLFAGLFIYLSGVSSRFSRSNLRRGLIVIAVAAGITVVTYFMDMPIWFGILHLLGFSMLFFGLTHKLWDMIPRYAAHALYIALIVISTLATMYFLPKSEHLFVSGVYWVLGWSQPGFISYDYFPLLPWLFVFLLSTGAGLFIVERKLPAWFYETETPVFPAIGRKALLIYILHQPILYGIVMGIKWLMEMQ